MIVLGGCESLRSSQIGTHQTLILIFHAFLDFLWYLISKHIFQAMAHFLTHAKTNIEIQKGENRNLSSG